MIYTCSLKVDSSSPAWKPMFDIHKELHSLRENGLWRHLTPHQGIDFASNDYLGLARSPDIRAHLIEFMKKTSQLGSTGSRLITGESEFYQETEALIADLFEVESALIFGSGYLANLGVMTALGSLENVEFFSDALNHASLIDGMRLTRKPIHIFKHNELNHLESLLKLSTAKRKIIVTESIFSMKGDSPDLKQLLLLIEQFQALLVLDEAHATGVCGKKGLGLALDTISNHNQIISIHTCGKALGAYGAFVTSNHHLRKLLINKSRSFIYSTALPPILLAHIQLALHEIQNGTQKNQLAHNIQFIKKIFTNASLEWNSAHIGFIHTPSNQKALAASEFLLAQGIHVRAIRSPTVAPNQEGLRITLKSFHTEQELQLLTNTLTKVII